MRFPLVILISVMVSRVTQGQELSESNHADSWPITSQIVIETSAEISAPIGSEIVQNVDDGTFSGTVSSERTISSGLNFYLGYSTRSLSGKHNRIKVRLDESIKIIARQDVHRITEIGTFQPIGDWEYHGERTDWFSSILFVQGIRVDIPIQNQCLITASVRGYFGFNMVNWKKLGGKVNGQETQFDRIYKTSREYPDFLKDNLLWGAEFSVAIAPSSFKGIYFQFSLPMIDKDFKHRPADINQELFSTQASYRFLVGLGYRVNLKK